MGKTDPLIAARSCAVAAGTGLVGTALVGPTTHRRRTVTAARAVSNGPAGRASCCGGRTGQSPGCCEQGSHAEDPGARPLQRLPSCNKPADAYGQPVIEIAVRESYLVGRAFRDSQWDTIPEGRNAINRSRWLEWLATPLAMIRLASSIT